MTSTQKRQLASVARTAVIALWTLSITLPLLAAAPPGFTGTWQRNEELSDDAQEKFREAMEAMREQMGRRGGMGGPGGSGGMGGLGQDHLVTVQGVSACLDRLSVDGLLTVTRGIQTPPRDNVKLLATFIEALKRRGIAAPQQHLVVVRDYLAVCTVLKASAWTPAEIERGVEILAQAIREMMNQ